MHRSAILTDYFKIKVTNVALCVVAFFTLKVLFSCGMCKCNLIYACRKITASHTLILKKLSDLNSILSVYLKPNIIQIRQ